MTVSPKTMADAIRVLSMDAVHKAKSGHQGMPMGMADVATVLWSRFLKFDAARPDWADRDRFVLSAGHGSMLLYSLLHLTGFKSMPMAEIENFRQWGSQDPRPPRVRPHRLASRPPPVRWARASPRRSAWRWPSANLAARFGKDLVDHRTWVIAGDGCLMEGVSHEAIHLAGRLKLAKLTVLFDDNDVTIDGEATIAETGDQRLRFKAAGWAVKAIDGNDAGAVRRALAWAVKQDRPTMIACKTKISKGAGPKEGDPHSHGYTLFDKEIADARTAMGWTAPPFVIPDDIAAAWRKVGKRGARTRKAWEARAEGPRPPAPSSNALLRGDLPEDAFAALAAHIAKTAADKPANATRSWSGAALEALIPAIPEMIGGSADLTGSNNTIVKGMKAFDTPDYAGRYVHYGVREHGMAAAMNGMALHGGVIPYSGTFLAFADYIAAGDPAGRADGRAGDPCDDPRFHRPGRGRPDPPAGRAPGLAARHAEPAGVPPRRRRSRPPNAGARRWRTARRRRSMALSRQKTRRRCATDAATRTCSARGAYELAAAEGDAQVTLFASGTEVAIAMAAREQLQAKASRPRVVSTPCWELFETQPADYRTETIGGSPARVAVEAGVRQGWERFIGEDGGFVGMSSFGASAPYERLYREFGITAEAVAGEAKAKLRQA